MTKIFTFTLCIIQIAIGIACSGQNNFTYWLPKRIVEKQSDNPNLETKTTFGYNEQFELVSVTRSESLSNHIYTAFIGYNEEGLIAHIKQTSTNPLVKEKNLKFTYNGSIITQIFFEEGTVKNHIRVSYDQIHNSYTYQKGHHNWMVDFDEDNNLNTIKAGDFTITRITSNFVEGICKDVVIQPALFLMQDQLEAINTLALFLYGTKEVSSIYYDEIEFSLETRRDEFGNIALINANDNNDMDLEFVISYDSSDMKL